jgi:SWI/SNF-related matrix-associated actin-dependent regulator 1 of chromatin subfamily A
MEITHWGGIWYANCPYEERNIPKEAGFWWHGGRTCAPGCRACLLDIGKKWWTPHGEKVTTLIDFCDIKAREALTKIVQAEADSRALSSDIEVPVPDGLEYLPFQKAAIEYSITRDRTLLSDEMGCGKSVESLGIVNHLKEKIKSILIICPAILRINWQREAARWLVKERESFVVISGQKTIPDSVDLVICNYDQLKGKVFEQLMNQQWDILIADEVSYLKNPDSKRTKATFGYKMRRKSGEKKGRWAPGLIHKAKKILFLSGTPMLNRPMELFPILHALDPDRWSDGFQFGRRYCAGYRKKIGWDVINQEPKYAWDFTGASHLDELQKILRSTIMIRRLKEQVLHDLPPKRREIIVFVADKSQQKIIAQETEAWKRHDEKICQLEFNLEAAKKSGSDDDYRSAVSGLKAGIDVAFVDMAEARKEVAVSKVTSVIEHLRLALEQVKKVVIYAHHHDVIDALFDEFKDVAVKVDGRTPNTQRQKAIDAFQTEEKISMFIGGIHAMGMGITLTAASHVVFAELDWTPAIMTQAEDRLHRKGQRKHVLVQHLVLDKSLDEKMAKILVKKQSISTDVLDGVKDHVATIPVTRKSYPKATSEQRWAAAEGLKQAFELKPGDTGDDGLDGIDTEEQFGIELAKTSILRKLDDKEVHLARSALKKRKEKITEEVKIILGISS